MKTKSEKKRSKIKVCFISTYSYPLFNKKSKILHGGAEVQMYFISTQLAKDKNFDVSFIVGDFGQKDMEVWEDVKVFKSPVKIKIKTIFSRIKWISEFIKFLKEIDVDIYFTTAANNTIGPTSLFCKIYNKKHIHRVASLMDVDKSFIKKSNWFVGRLYRYGLTHADSVFVHNETQKNILLKNHKKDSQVIRHSYFLKSMPKKKGDYVLWVGRYDYMKKPELFLELAKKFPKNKFVIICNYNPFWPKESEEIRKKALKQKNVEYIERVPFEEIQKKYYDKAKVFVNTSDFEGYPNSFAQAGLGATPILSLNVSPENYLDKYKCGYFGKGSMKIMENKLRKLLTNKKDWKMRSKNIFKYVKENNNIEINVAKIKKEIESLYEKESS